MTRSGDPGSLETYERNHHYLKEKPKVSWLPCWRHYIGRESPFTQGATISLRRHCQKTPWASWPRQFRPEKTFNRDSSGKDLQPWCHQIHLVWWLGLLYAAKVGCQRYMLATVFPACNNWLMPISVSYSWNAAVGSCYFCLLFMVRSGWLLMFQAMVGCQRTPTAPYSRLAIQQ